VNYPQQPANAGMDLDVPTMIPTEHRTWGMLCHLLALTTLIGIPLGSILGPMVMWLVKKNDSPFVDAHGRESMNFGISVLIYSVVCIPLCFILIGIPMLIALWIFWLVMVIVNAMKANDGKMVRYPLTIRML